MKNSLIYDFLFITFVLIAVKLVMNYGFEDDPLTLTELFDIKMIISIIIGVILGVIVMRWVRKIVS